LRTEHFPSLRTPALFVSGEKDGFGTREELDKARSLMPSRTELMMVPGVGHELIPAKKMTGLPAQVVQSFQEFVSGG